MIEIVELNEIGDSLGPGDEGSDGAQLRAQVQGSPVSSADMIAKSIADTKAMREEQDRQAEVQRSNRKTRLQSIFQQLSHRIGDTLKIANPDSRYVPETKVKLTSVGQLTWINHSDSADFITVKLGDVTEKITLLSNVSCYRNCWTDIYRHNEDSDSTFGLQPQAQVSQAEHSNPDDYGYSVFYESDEL